MNKSAMLRMMLAQEGITLDPPVAHPYASRGSGATAGPPVDRAAIAAVLRGAGVPDHRVEWMAASCPSLERARWYVASLPPAQTTEGEPMRPIEGETYEDDRGRWFRVDVVNEGDPNDREVVGVVMADQGTGIGRNYACSMTVFRKVWRAR